MTEVDPSCGGCEEERGEEQDVSETGSEDTEEARNDPNFVVILLSSSAGSEPLCEMASERTPIPQPPPVDSGAAETVIPRTWFPNHKTVEPEGSKRGVFYTTADGGTVENEGDTTLIMSSADRSHPRKVTVQVANVNKPLGSVSKMVRNGNRVVFGASGLREFVFLLAPACSCRALRIRSFTLNGTPTLFRNHGSRKKLFF